MIGQWLSERLGQPFTVENRPGAGVNIGTEAAVRAPADGYTLVLVSAGNAINATFYELKSDEFSFVFLRRLRFGDGRRPRTALPLHPMPSIDP
jgi:tripartite-type tricarboxylate transporter receptor subunit TctC